MDKIAFNEMWEQVQQMGFNAEFKDVLLTQVNSGRHAFDLIHHSMTDHNITAVLKVRKDKGTYLFPNLLVAVSPVITIAHFNCLKYGTRDLEKRMEKTDWGKAADLDIGPYADPLSKEDDSLRSSVSGIWQDMRMLMGASNPDLIGTGLLLQRKYWAMSPFAEMAALAGAGPQITGLLHYRFDLSVMMPTIAQAANMVCGRPVCIMTMSIPDGEKPMWYQLTYDESHALLEPRMKAYPYQDLKPFLDTNPIQQVRADARSIDLAIKNGRLVHLAIGDNGYLMSYDASREQFRYFNHELIPVSEQSVVAAVSLAMEQRAERKQSSPKRLIRIGRPTDGKKGKGSTKGRLPGR